MKSIVRYSLFLIYVSACRKAVTHAMSLGFTECIVVNTKYILFEDNVIAIISSRK